ncbi:DUF5067 domain-containing protein [Fructobacillus sp. M1-13]|uniref:DUF5067 domain-containing protein n=1 Tax=Fructobacillus papyriferae TaxID=2713171 RepID=A0ABS5QPL8_9LACO|nr:DUF5067 domain-containing protein [Fructobacillus papyriferae]MBS9335106.1 DUF5067 domain-containing protein [Fructobacillus papyriferae]MCD2159408.1 DUF5067 domain-containing protein [Fructobacillus papyriferae]
MLKNKKFVLSAIVVAVVAVLGVAFSTFQSQNTEKASTTSKTTKSEKTQGNDKEWSVKGHVFHGGSLVFDMKNSEVVDSTDGSKIIAIHTKLSDVSDIKTVSSAAVYGAITASQKVNGQDKELYPAPSQSKNDQVNEASRQLKQKLEPGQSHNIALMFALENNSDVTLHFQNPDKKEIGTTTFKVN